MGSTPTRFTNFHNSIYHSSKHFATKKGGILYKPKLVRRCPSILSALFAELAHFSSASAHSATTGMTFTLWLRGCNNVINSEDQARCFCSRINHLLFDCQRLKNVLLGDIINLTFDNT